MIFGVPQEKKMQLSRYFQTVCNYRGFNKMFITEAFICLLTHRELASLLIKVKYE